MAFDQHLTLVTQVKEGPSRMLGKIADLERRVSTLERRFSVQVVTGEPKTEPRDGAFAADTANFIWVRINGAWKSVPVT